MKTKKGLIVLALIISGALTGCKKDSDTSDPVNENIKLRINLFHAANNKVVMPDSIAYTNAFGNDFSVITLKYFISDIVLHNNNGSIVELNEIHYVDAFDASTTSITPLMRVPNGSYSHVSFTFGIDSTKNVTGIFPNPPENLMEWPLALGTGYHYMKLEGKHNNSGTIKNYQCHTGPTQNVDYSVNVVVPASGFNANGADITMGLAFQIEKWWENPNTLDLNNMTMVMGNPVMQQMLMQNGQDVFKMVSVK